MISSCDHCPLIAELEKRRAAIDTTISLLREFHLPAEIVPAAALAKNGKRTYTRRKSSPVISSKEEGRQSPLQDAILEVLKHGPKTSIETFEVLTDAGVVTTSGSIYQTLHMLERRGTLKKIQNEDGRMAWALK